jgi:regulator of sirC expression with transglutaminase-like and TPR domain
MSLPAGSDGPLQAFSDLPFKTLAIRPSPDLHDPCNLLPSAVLERKVGYCVGIAAVYLALAERLDLPIYAVATPSRVFLRYDDGERRINIETLQAGVSISDDQYAAEQKIAPTSIRRGIFLRDLSDDQFLAQVYNNLGMVYSERKQFAEAERAYRQALDLHPDLAAAWHNWGKDLFLSGQYPRAIKAFTRSLKLHPNDVWALNRGMAYRKIGKNGNALKDFAAALGIEPGFEPARSNFAGLESVP